MSYINQENKLTFPHSLTFDDVLLLPNYTDFSRDDVDLSTKLSSKIELKLPLISSPMDTVTMSEMAINLAKNGALGIIHRNLSIDVQALEISKVKNTIFENTASAITDTDGKLVVGAAVGVGDDLAPRVKALVEAEVDVLVVDSAHGHSKLVIEATKFIKINYPQIILISGNVTSYDGALALIEAGTDAIRVGMGPGSICTTRIVTGMGVPQLTAISEVARAAKDAGVKIIADGGIKQLGDISKALGFGADCVMLGSMLAGFDESPGEIFEKDGKKYKSYRGMGSVGAMVDGSNSRYGQSPDPKKMVAEGVEALVNYKGAVDLILNQISGGLRSSLFYTGSKNLSEFYQKARFIKISNAGLKESHPHSISITNSGNSYFG